MRPAGSIFLAGTFVLVQTPVLAKGGEEALGVMSVSLDEVVKPQLEIQGLTQGAGTPNLLQANAGRYFFYWFVCQAMERFGNGCWILGRNSVLFPDALANVNHSDFSGYSSIINTEVACTTISSSYTVTAG